MLHLLKIDKEYIPTREYLRWLMHRLYHEDNAFPLRTASSSQLNRRWPREERVTKSSFFIFDRKTGLQPEAGEKRVHEHVIRGSSTYSPI